jgi:hypothetical protein
MSVCLTRVERPNLVLKVHKQALHSGVESAREEERDIDGKELAKGFARK